MPIVNEHFDDILDSGVTGATFEATLYKWNPSFELTEAGTDTAHHFDAVEWEGDLYRATSSAVEKLVGTTWTAVSGYAAASGQKTDTPPSLVADTNLHIFAPTNSGISTRYYNGSSWSSWSTVVSVSGVAHLAATTPTTVHYLIYDLTGRHYNFRVATYSGSWSPTASDIFWGYRINSFAAKRIDGRDVLAFAGNVPGVNSTKVVGTKTVKYVIPAGGVFVITHQYASWSDHFTVEKIDKWSAARFRSHLCMSVINDVLWLTCYSSEETVQGIRAYTSKDGRNWSRGELLALPQRMPFGTVLVYDDEQIYAVSAKATQRAYSTLWFGVSHETQMIDISDYVLDWSASRKDIQEVSLTLARNSTLDASFVTESCTMALILKTGFGAVLQQIGIFEVDMTSFNWEVPTQTLQLSARDHLMWLSARSQSEQFKQWEPQVIGVDEYIDTTDTGYGGLTHTAPFKGSYATDDSTLVLKTNNEEGIAISTFHFDEWNGMVQSGFSLSELDNDEYAGLVFRLQDKDNGYIYRYEQADDKLHLYHRLSGVDIPKWESSTQGWDGNTNFRYLMVEFRYCRIKLYTGDVSGNWTLAHSMLLDGEGDNPEIHAGYVGTTGRGFSDEDTWENEAEVLLPPVLPPDFIPYTYIVADFEYEEAE